MAWSRLDRPAAKSSRPTSTDARPEGCFIQSQPRTRQTIRHPVMKRITAPQMAPIWTPYDCLSSQKSPASRSPSAGVPALRSPGPGAASDMIHETFRSATPIPDRHCGAAARGAISRSPRVLLKSLRLGPGPDQESRIAGECETQPRADRSGQRVADLRSPIVHEELTRLQDEPYAQADRGGRPGRFPLEAKRQQSPQGKVAHRLHDQVSQGIDIGPPVVRPEGDKHLPSQLPTAWRDEQRWRPGFEDDRQGPKDQREADPGTGCLPRVSKHDQGADGGPDRRQDDRRRIRPPAPDRQLNQLDDRGYPHGCRHGNDRGREPRRRASMTARALSPPSRVQTRTSPAHPQASAAGGGWSTAGMNGTSRAPLTDALRSPRSRLTSNGASDANSTPRAETAVNTATGCRAAADLRPASTLGQSTRASHQPRPPPRAEPAVFVATSIQEETREGAKS